MARYPTLSFEESGIQLGAHEDVKVRHDRRWVRYVTIGEHFRAKTFFISPFTGLTVRLGNKTITAMGLRMSDDAFERAVVVFPCLE